MIVRSSDYPWRRKSKAAHTGSAIAAGAQPPTPKTMRRHESPTTRSLRGNDGSRRSTTATTDRRPFRQAYAGVGFGFGLTSGSGSFGRRRCGSHSSHVGRYQFQSPSTFMLAGSSTPRMIVASISTATQAAKAERERAEQTVPATA